MSQIRNPKGAGRPLGTGKYKGEKTQMVRVPVSRKEEVKEFLETNSYSLPIYDVTVKAGIPEFLDNTDAEYKNILHLLTDHPQDSFLVTAEGDSMIGAGIKSGDILVVDSKIEPMEGSIVVASIDNECTVKRLKYNKKQPFLYPENEKFKPIPINEENNVTIWGVVKRKISDLN